MAKAYKPLFDPRGQFCDASGNPLNGGFLYFYEAGTSTPLDTFTTPAATVANSNPITLDSEGRHSSGIYLKPQLYKIVLKNSAGTTIWTEDNYNGGGFLQIALSGSIYVRSVDEDADINIAQVTTGREMQFGAASTTTSTGTARYNVNVGAGRPTTSGAQGGALNLFGGAGAAAGNSAGGDLTLTPGAGVGTGLKGIVSLLGMLKLTTITYTAADTTPSVRAGNVMVVTNAGPISITAFDDPQESQVLVLLFTDGNTTLVDAAGLQLAGGANFVGSANDIMVLVYINSVWYECARSLN